MQVLFFCISFIKKQYLHILNLYYKCNIDYFCKVNFDIFRGNKGFVAMGDLGKEYYTGLPDGEYCDIIHDCQQKIQVDR